MDRGLFIIGLLLEKWLGNLTTHAETIAIKVEQFLQHIDAEIILNNNYNNKKSILLFFIQIFEDNFEK